MTRKLLACRPELGACCCGGVLEFVTVAWASVMETLDNGAMPRKVERLRDAEALTADHADAITKPEGTLV